MEHQDRVGHGGYPALQNVDLRTIIGIRLLYNNAAAVTSYQTR